MNLMDTLQPSYRPDLSRAKKVSFSKPDEIKEDLKKDAQLRREANAINDQHRRTLKAQEKAWREYEIKKAQARRAIVRAEMALDKAHERLKNLKKPPAIGLTEEDDQRVNSFLANRGAHAKSLVGIPSFIELESLPLVKRQEVSSSS